MPGKHFFVTALLLLAAVTLAGCALSGEPAKKNELVLGELPYTTIEIPSDEFDALNEGDFAAWYESHYQVEGAHYLTIGEDRYVLISAGEKPTAGYYLEDIIFEGTETNIITTASLHRPGEDEMAATVITYPHALLRIPEDGRPMDLCPLTDTPTEVDAKTDTGRYVGQIDSNSIEIKISGVPDAIAARAFQLGDELKADFAGLDLDTDDEIRFRYLDREEGQPIIIAIEPMH